MKYFMMVKANKKILSMFLVFVMVLSVIPINAVADIYETYKNYERITSMEQLTTGKYIMLVGDNYSPTEFDSGWLKVKQLESKEQITTQSALILTINEDKQARITDKNGVSLAPKGGNQNGIKEGNYYWDIECSGGTFKFKGTGADTVILASNTGSENKIRGYKVGTVTNNPNSYPYEFTLYKDLTSGDIELPPEIEKPQEPENTEKPPIAGVLQTGNQVVIYNVAAKGVLGGQDDNETSPSVESVSATISDEMVDASNGARVFTVEENGEYLRFRTENDGYLCSNGTGSNAFYQKEASDDADWKLAEYNGGYTLESRTAKYQGKYSQYLEYYSESYKTYSLYNVTDKDIYTFKFYPCTDEVLTDGVVNEPTVNFVGPLETAVNQEYQLNFTIDAVFGVNGEITAMLGEEALEVSLGEGEVYSVVIPAEKVKGEVLTVVVKAMDSKGKEITGTAEIKVIDIPVINKVTPEEGGQVASGIIPDITAEFSNAGTNPTVTVTIKRGTTVIVENAKMTIDKNIASYMPEVELADGRYSITVTITREDGKIGTKSWVFNMGEVTSRLYFGQLHSHTTYSDGSGSLSAALDYIKSLPESANVDFVAFTDHSNYFDEKNAANPEEALYDMSKATAYSQQRWNEYKRTIDAFNAENTDVIAIGGFEMTWSGGPGHINTFNTPGIVSRNNQTLNNKTNDSGLKAYYNLLSQPEGENSLSQLNHPGATFGNFVDFSYWDAVIDTRVQLVEVGNGEGAIGAGGYYPSYEQYTMALDKGWHVAPTNNQDNHKGRWGNANDARDVILTDDFTETGIYDAIRERRMYATEDKNLEVYYTLNGELLGTVIPEKPSTVEVNVEVSDPDRTDKISKVEVIVNSGKTAYTWNDASEIEGGLLSCTLDTSDAVSYYYIRVTQADGDLAVTAPVWVGETMRIGISSIECSTSTPVTDEELTLTTTLFNSETNDVKVKNITYTTNGSQVVGSDSEVKVIPASGTLDVTYSFTPKVARATTITATVVVEVSGEELIFTKDITLDISDASKLAYIGIDASHYNEYVAGNYKDSMGNLSQLASEYNVRTVELDTSEALIKACENTEGKYKALILTVPSRRNGNALRDPYAVYTDEELKAIKAFNEAGGTVVIAGWSDYYETYGECPAEDHMAAQQNKLLEVLGSKLRISDDATTDTVLNGGQSQRLYFSTYNFNSPLMEGVEYDEANPNNNMYSQLFSQYGGASIYAVDAAGNPTSQLASTITPVVYGHATTYSVDSDNDGIGGTDIPKYAVGENDERLLVLASEQIGNQGLIVVSGAAFMSNFEVQVSNSDSNAEKNYSNYNICENLIKLVNPVELATISEVQAQENEGVKYTVEGIVTSNASGYDKDTAFFDCIYIQDETAGINCFPVAGEFKIGDKVRISGITSSYNGERQLNVTSIEAVGIGEVEATTVTAKQINDGTVLGQLIKLSGKIVAVQEENGLIQTLMVKDAEGNVARVFIDGYITTSQDVENAEVGNEIIVIGLASYDNSFDGIAPRIRIRDRKDITCTTPGETNKPSDDDKPSHDDDKPSHDDDKPSHDDDKPSSGGGSSSNKPSSGSSSSSKSPQKVTTTTAKPEIKSEAEVTLKAVSDIITQVISNYKDTNISVVGTGIAVEGKEFIEPAVLKMPVDKTNIKDTNKLAIAKVEVDKDNKVSIKLFGGTYDEKAGTISAYINQAGNYFVVTAESFNTVNLTINSLKSTINSKEHSLDVAPVIINDRTMVPLRFIVEAFGADVTWDTITKTVSIEVNDEKLTMTVNKKEQLSGTTPIIMNNRTMVPIRYISETFGANVIWIPSTQGILIVK